MTCQTILFLHGLPCKICKQIFRSYVYFQQIDAACHRCFHNAFQCYLVHMIKHTLSILLTCRAKLLMYVLVCTIMYTLLRLTLHFHCRKEVIETNARRSTYSSFNWASLVAASCSARMKMKAWNWCIHDENQIQNEKLYPWHDWVWWRIERFFAFPFVVVATSYTNVTETKVCMDAWIWSYIALIRCALWMCN